MSNIYSKAKMVARKHLNITLYKTLPIFISLYNIPLIITLSMAIDIPYSVWGKHRSQRNIWTSEVFSVIKELRLKKASSFENRKS
jgi:hypothetical protein